MSLKRSHIKRYSSYSITVAPAEAYSQQLQSALDDFIFFNAKLTLIMEHTGKSPAQ